MLADIERKLLRILYNDTRSGGRVPPISKLAVRIGRSPEAVPIVLKSLTDKGYIDWSPNLHGHLQVIKAWEDHQSHLLRKDKPSAKLWEMESF